MSTSFSAEVKVFGKPITITPNTEIPHRIESNQTIVLKLSDNDPNNTGKTFGQTIGDYFPMPSSDFNIKGITDLEISKLMVDTQTHDFQIAMKVDFDDNFFLNKFKKVLEIDSLALFVSSLTDAEVTTNNAKNNPPAVE